MSTILPAGWPLATSVLHKTYVRLNKWTLRAASRSLGVEQVEPPSLKLVPRHHRLTMRGAAISAESQERPREGDTCKGDSIMCKLGVLSTLTPVRAEASGLESWTIVALPMKRSTRDKVTHVSAPSFGVGLPRQTGTQSKNVCQRTGHRNMHNMSC